MRRNQSEGEVKAALLAEVRQLADQMGRLPPDQAFNTPAMYTSLQPLHALLGQALTGIRANCSPETLDEIERLRALKVGLRMRTGSQTGSADTPEETWKQMRAASLSGESLRSLAARFGVLYTALLRRRRKDERGRWNPETERREDLRPWGAPKAPKCDVIELFPAGRRLAVSP